MARTTQTGRCQRLAFGAQLAGLARCELTPTDLDRERCESWLQE